MAGIKGKQIEDGSIGDLKLTTPYIKADGTRPFTDNQSLGGKKITSSGSPSAGGDLTNKDYVDALLQGLSWKTPGARAASIGPGTLATDFENGDLLDDVTLVTGDSVLLKDQAAASENGIYVVAVSGAPTRRVDADTPAKLKAAAIIVMEGTVNKNLAFTQTGDGITFAVNSVWGPFGTLSPPADGAGLSLSGGILSVNAGDGISLTVPTPDAVNVNVTDIVGDGTENDGSNNIRVKLDSDSMSRSAGGLKAATPSKGNKGQSPSVTSGDGSTTGLTITATPAGDGYVEVMVNHASYEVGDGVKTKDSYFSSDGGVTAKGIAAITAGDTLYWDGVVTGFDLATTDLVSMMYNIIN